MLDPDSARLLRSLVHGRAVGSLATLHEGRPFASMIPFAAWRDAGRLRLITHVSRLSAHTRDMLDSPEVCLMITAAESAAIPPQAIPRASIPAVAEFIAPEHGDYAACKRAYLGKFPFATEWFALADFSIVAFTPQSVRFIAGFARALNVSLAQLRDAVADNA
jgi:putative heme iron utilization protein